MLLSKILVRDKNNLDLLRLILATLVILGHSNPLNGMTVGYSDPINLLFPMEHIHTLAVKIFLFVSGLVVTNSLLETRSAGTFLISRAFRILPNLVVLLLITVFVVGPLASNLSPSQYFSERSTYAYLLKNSVFDTVFTLPGVFVDTPYPNAVNGSLWTLSVEIPCYLVVLAVFLLSVRMGRERATIAFFSIVTIVDTAFNGHSLFTFLGENSEVYMLPSIFAFGALMALFKNKIVFDFRLPASAVVLTFVFQKSQAYHELLLISFCLSALYLFSLPAANRFRLPFDISYGVYLWGFLVQQSIVHWLGPLTWWWHMGLSVLVTIAIATVCHWLVEMPFMAWGKLLIHRFFPKPQTKPLP